MPSELRQPTPLGRLKELIQQVEEQAQARPVDTNFDAGSVIDWLDWTLSFLEQRKLYHKKAYVRKAILERMAKTLLSPDELAVIDQEAEKQLSLKAAGVELEPEPEEVE